MTDEQRVELEGLDAAIAAAPTPYHWGLRALFWARFEGEEARVVDDSLSALGGVSAWKFGEHLFSTGACCWQYRHAHSNVVEHRYAAGMAASWLHLALGCAGLQDGLSRQFIWELAGANEENAATMLKQALRNCGELDGWRSIAIACALVQGTQAGARVYARWLRARAAEAENIGADLTSDVAGGQVVPHYQRLAEFDVALEDAPDDVRLLRGRAQWLKGAQLDELALESSHRLLQLRPDDPELYELRADCQLSCLAPRKLRSTRPTDGQSHDLVLADWVCALELRIAAGEMAGDARSLKARADALRKVPHRFQNLYHLQSLYQALACFTVALKAAPAGWALHLARAQTLATLRTAPQTALLPDFARALALAPRGKRPRGALIKFLVQTTKRDTAHAQLEALLKARQILLDAGINEALANAIIGEVERALAA